MWKKEAVYVIFNQYYVVQNGEISCLQRSWQIPPSLQLSSGASSFFHPRSKRKKKKEKVVKVSLCVQQMKYHYSQCEHYGGKLSMLLPWDVLRGSSPNEAAGSWSTGGLLHGTEGQEGRVMIIWYSFCGLLCQGSHTHTHAPSPHFHRFSCHFSSPQGSHCQFLPGFIIALLASACNGPVLGNPELQLRLWLKITLLIPPPYPCSFALSPALSSALFDDRQ